MTDATGGLRREAIHRLLEEARNSKPVRGRTGGLVMPTTDGYNSANPLELWLTVTTEELGETARAILELRHCSPDQRRMWLRNLVEESAQTAQLSLRICSMAFDLLDAEARAGR